MKLQLAMRMLADLMNWKDEQVTHELPWLRLMVNYKYDHYQGYSPGTRFCVNLIYWLRQFPTPDEREIAYRLVRKELIYISPREMLHLVALSMAEIKRTMRRTVGNDLNLKMHQTWGDSTAHRRLKIRYLRTLYIGLSDGAKTDSFRRYNEEAVSNEQIVASAEISAAKWSSLVSDLRKSLDKNGFKDVEATFEHVCLLDDFTASGSTLIRKDDQENWSGKIPRFCNSGFPREPNVLAKDCTIHAHHYIATEKAKRTIGELINLFSCNQPFKFELSFSTILGSHIVINESFSDSELVALITDCYDKGIEDTHTKTDIWFGYKQCGLPLILDHNTPNNSVALLWAETNKDKQNGFEMHPLFPRIKRHTEHGQSI